MPGTETTGTPSVPAPLAARIGRDLRAPPPVRADARGIGLRLGLVLVATQLVGVAVALGMGVRAGSEATLVLPALGATAALVAGGYALGREAIPGRGAAALAWALALALGAAMFGALVYAQDRAAAEAIDQPVSGCLGIGSALGLVPLLFGLVAARRGHVVRPVLAGAAMGVLGAVVGLTTLHLHCPGAAWTHAGLVHGGLVVVLGVVGALVGRSALRVRRASD